MTAEDAPIVPGASEPVRSDLEAGVLRLTLDVPRNRNALSSALVAALADQLDHAGSNPDVRVIVLGHTGSTFCAGADLDEAAREGGPVAGTQRLVALLRRMLTCPRPIIG